MANRLGGASSAYLRSAAHQPIHWHPWNETAFAAAQAGDKPILLDIGAVWCHWCHVMDGESYEDPGLAEFLNQHFVCIKVDRDERPDVDARYQRAVQAITGQGGWPLTAFLTPGGEVFYGGTYFPPDDRYGRPGLRTVLEEVLSVWRNRRPQAVDQAAAIGRALERLGDLAEAGEVGPGALLAGERHILAVFDPAFGGFGTQPKFPHPTALRFLMARWADTRSPDTRHTVLETLRAMARGGIHDHVGGGFHRYSVDRRWIVPHFEKMSYDNSELLRAFAQGAALFEESEFAAAARGIARWVREVLALEGGGFGTSQDADVGLHDDGSYFTWSREELAEALAPEDLDLTVRRFGVGSLGRMLHDPEQNVLFLAQSTEELARELQRPISEVESRLDAIVTRLAVARARRPPPAVDRTPYTSWNAMMAGALLAAAPVLDDPWVRDQALSTLDRLRRHAPASDRLGHGPPPESGMGLLEDQVTTADAALDAFETTGESGWCTWAEQIMDRVWREHWDGERGGLTDRPTSAAGEGLLTSPVIPLEDAPVPSPNGVAGVVAARLAAHTGADRWRERHRMVVEAFGGSAPRLGLHTAAWLLAADWLVHEPAYLLITGPPGDPEADAMHRAALGAPLPRRVVRRLTPGIPIGSLPTELRGTLAEPGLTRAYLCVGTRCLMPADNAAAWRERLAEAVQVPA